MFFIPYDYWKALFFIKVYRYSEGFSCRHVVAFFETSVLKEIRVLCYPCNNSTILLSNFQINLSYIIHYNPTTKFPKKTDAYHTCQIF